VGQNPNSVSPVVGTDGTSWNNKRLAGVAFAFQVSQHTVEAHTDVSSNVLTQDPSGPDFLYKTEKFRPEVAVICLALSLPGSAKWLTGISSANKSNVCDSVIV
jgi:hypothetical protein